jgi:hypothetical protein
MSAALFLPTLEQLRNYVRQALCVRDRLDPVQTPLVESVVSRAGRPCGLLFHARGPRLLQTHAIWVATEQRLLFYDSTGNRFAEHRLRKGPDIEPVSMVTQAARKAA